MKYTTFRALFITGGIVVCGGLTALAVTTCGSTAEPEPAAKRTSAPATAVALAPGGAPAGPAAPQPAAATPNAEGDMPLRAMDRKILARAEQNIGSDKEKDAVRGESFKVNLYKDAGKSKVNRLKVDLDRDEKFDEKWTFEDDGRVKRQVAPEDDEKYTVEYRLEGEGWRLKK